MEEPYFQRQLLANGATAPSPYLSGNPQLSRIAQISGTETNGNQSYNALQATLRKRYSAGLEFQGAYTYSKGMSDAIGYYGEGGQAAEQGEPRRRTVGNGRVDDAGGTFRCQPKTRPLERRGGPAGSAPAFPHGRRAIRADRLVGARSQGVQRLSH